MKKNLQFSIQIIFFALFIFLGLTEKIQLWMGLFLVGVVASALLGRIFCGWICPINTAMIAVTWIKRKLHIKTIKIPPILTKPWVRFAALGLFVISFIFIMISGTKLPVIHVLFALGILLTFFFPEELWHRYLCPFGAILSFPASKSSHNMIIDADKCNNCGACVRVCPAKAVEKNEKHHIIKRDCLICFKCARGCNQSAISYK